MNRSKHVRKLLTAAEIAGEVLAVCAPGSYAWRTDFDGACTSLRFYSSRYIRPAERRAAQDFPAGPQWCVREADSKRAAVSMRYRFDSEAFDMTAVVERVA